MTGSTVTKAQLGAIHALKKRCGLDDDAYRDMLEQQARVRSAADLGPSQAGKVIEHLQRLADGAGSGALDLDGPFVAIVRALWISGYHLGVVQNRTDRAMVAFVKRQTGIDHLNWIRDPADAARVIEGLKAWLSREAGVDWPKGKGDTPSARRYSVVMAQLRILGLKAPPQMVLGDMERSMQAYGRRVRALKAEA